MAYDEGLAARIRDHVSDLAPQVTERKMFGGLAFLVDGNMAVAASGEGGLMLRCAPEETERLVAEPGAAPMMMRGRPLDGWLRVDGIDLDEERFGRWVRIGVAYAASLPAKG
jgi:TfoX/Sxy family transcriptional regulator of competence genes